MTQQTIQYQTDGPVARIRLNRPDQLNALNTPLLQALREAIETAANDDNIRAVLLCAAGRAFCTGADLKQGFSSGLNTGDTLRTYYHPIIELLHTMAKPVIARVQGPAVGAGASLALAADLVIAGRAAHFAQVFTNIGLVPDAGSTWIMPRLIGHARARAAVLTGEPIDAETAEQWGLIWRVVDDDTLADEADQAARTMAARPTRALGLAKQLLDQSSTSTLAEQLEHEARAQIQAESTDDFAEAVQAFLDKRKAQFTGH